MKVMVTVVLSSVVCVAVFVGLCNSSQGEESTSDAAARVNVDGPTYPWCWCATQCYGDCDCDGDVDTEDWAIFRDAFGTNCEQDWNGGAGPYNPCAHRDHGGDVDTVDWTAFRGARQKRRRARG